MFRWFVFVLALTLGTVFYQYPSLYRDLKDRAPVWLGMKSNSTLYRWMDKDGNWQISDKPPAEGIKFEILTIGHNKQKIFFTQK